MLISVLLLLLVCGTQAGFHGYVFTYTTKTTQVIIHRRFSFSLCEEFDLWCCSGNCSTKGNVRKNGENVGEWCQKEIILSRLITTLTLLSQWRDGRTNWVPNMNGITKWKYFLYAELRNRSDINKPNSSPQTNVLPAVRVPSNCQRNISLLTFDPDGDVVTCRYAAGEECDNCTTPFDLSLSSSCTLSFSPSSSSNEGSYAVQMMMEEFPRQNITLTDNMGQKEVKTTTDYISMTHIQLVFKVLPAVPFCSEGFYLPRFLPPTPENGAQISATVNQTLIITIGAEATKSVISELLYSGPYSMVKSSSGSGTFTLTWTPSDLDNEESHPVCFVVQATYSGSEYQSEHRCLIVTVTTTPPPPTQYHVFYVKMKITTSLPSENNKEVLEKAIKDVLVRRGMPPTIGVRLLSDGLVEIRTTAPPSG